MLFDRQRLGHQTMTMQRLASLRSVRQLGGLRVLREVFHGFSEEARTRGFPSPPFGGFGFIVSTTNYSRKLLDCLTVNIIWTYSRVGNDRFGSLAALFSDFSSMSASKGKADVRSWSIL